MKLSRGVLVSCAEMYLFLRVLLAENSPYAGKFGKCYLKLKQLLFHLWLLISILNIQVGDIVTIISQMYFTMKPFPKNLS